MANSPHPTAVTYEDTVGGLDHSSLYELLSERVERINYEVRAAWRMGYDYAHVYERVEDFEFETYVLPCNVASPPTAEDNLRYKETYVLDDERIMTAKEKLRQ